MSFDILKRELKNGTFRNIYLFYGPETYLLNYYVKSFKDKLLDNIAMQLNYIILEGSVSVSDIISFCTTLPMFSDNKLVVLKRVGVLKPTYAALTELFSDFPDFTHLIIIEDTVDKRLKLYKDIVKYGLPVEFAIQPPYALEDWVKNICTKEGKSFDRPALALFMQKSEPFMTEIKNELDKLLLYTGERKRIVIDDVNNVCSFSAKTRIFDLIDSLVNGNRQKAASELNDLLSLKEPVQKIMIMISKHFIQLRQLKNLAIANTSLADATSMLGINPYAAKIMWRQCAKYQLSRLDDIIRKCYMQDLAVKSGNIDSDSALDILIASI
jgi:DNA polymerase-3 subunit delta